MTRLIVWRHGRTAWNAENRVQGQTDIELDETGVEQARLSAARLAPRRPDAIVASDLRRAYHTAEQLAVLTGLPIQVDPRLRERDFGDWQGLPMTEVAERYPQEHARWRAGEPVAGCRIEENDDLAKRVASAFLAAAEQLPGGTVVLATHGAAAKYGAAALLGWPMWVVRTTGSLGNCHWLELHLNAEHGWRMLSYNMR